MVGRHIRKASLWFALSIILAASFISLLPLPQRTPKASAQTASEIKSWFELEEITPSPAHINFNDLSSTPSITIEPHGVRPKRVVFKLSHVGSEGFGFYLVLPPALPIPISTYQNVDWLVFQGYLEDGTKLDNLYVLVNDGGSVVAGSPNPDEYIVYDTDGGGVKQGKFTRLNSRPFDTFDPEVEKLFGYLFNAPADEPKTDKNCKNVEGYKSATFPDGLRKSGPETKSDTKSNLLDWGYSGGDILRLNGNCLNQDSGGWASKWGVTTHSVPSDIAAGGPCSITKLIGTLSVNIGAILGGIIVCTIESIFSGAVDPLVGYVTAAFSGQENGKLGDYETELKNPESVIVTVWKDVLGLVNIIVILALLVIAFANILHLNINTYAAKKALPGLVLGVVGANASLLLMRFLADVTQAVTVLALNFAGIKPASVGAGIASLILQFVETIGKSVIGGMITAAIAGIATGTFGILIIIVVIFALYFLFLIVAFASALFKRIVIVYGLSMLAPLAFIAYGVPSFQSYFYKWWDNYLRYLFMFPVILFGIALVVRLGQSIPFATVGTATINTTGLIYAIILFTAATFVLKLPKMITNGAIDLAETAKKAMGIAKQAPINAAASYQGYNKLKGNRFRAEAGNLRLQRKRLMDEARVTANPHQRAALVQQARDINRQLVGKLGSANKADKKSDFGRRARVAGNIAAYPEKTVKDWLKSKQERLDKGTAKETGKSKFQDILSKNSILQGKVGKKSIPNTFMGPEEALAKSIDFAKDEAQKFDSPEKIQEAIKDPSLKKIREMIGTYKGVALETEDERNSFNKELVDAADRPTALFDLVEKLRQVDPGFSPSEYELASLTQFAKRLYNVSRRNPTYNTSAQQALNEAFPFGSGSPASSGSPGGGGNTPPSGGGPSPSSSPTGSTVGTGATINTGSVTVNANQQVSPSSGLGINQVSDLMNSLKPLDADERDERRNKLEELSSHWQSLKDLDFDNLTTEDEQEINELKAETRTMFGATVAEGARELQGTFNQALESRPTSESVDSLARFTAGLSEVMEGVPESTQRLIAHQNALGGQAVALNQAGSQWVAGKNEEEMKRLADLLASNQESLVSQMSQELGAPISDLLKANGQQGTAEEVRQITTSMVNGLNSIMTGRSPRSLIRQMQTTFSNMGTDISKRLSYAQSSQPEIKVNVQAGKPNIIVEPPNAQNVTNITNENISNQTTNEINQSASPVNPGQSAATESLASELRSRVEPPPTEPPVPPSTS
jgi:hypothetical protein